MTSQESYRELLESIREAHARHRKVWEDTKRETGDSGKAYKAAKAEQLELYRHLQTLYETRLTPLQEPFLAGRPEAIDEIISFLEIDVPAFRVGYDKEWYYGKLKKLTLNPEQAERLRLIALARCSSNEYRREDSEIRKLMVRLADPKFIHSVTAIRSQKGSRVDWHKSKMLRVVLQGRQDLRDQLKSMPGSTS